MSTDKMDTLSMKDEQNYCEVCGMDVSPDNQSRKFSKYFCSNDHLAQYVRTRQMKEGMIDEHYELPTKHENPTTQYYQEEDESPR